MLSPLVHTPHQILLPLIRVAQYGTPAKTLGQDDVIIENCGSALYCNKEYTQLYAKPTNLGLAKGFSISISVCIWIITSELDL